MASKRQAMLPYPAGGTTTTALGSSRPGKLKYLREHVELRDMPGSCALGQTQALLHAALPGPSESGKPEKDACWLFLLRQLKLAARRVRKSDTLPRIQRAARVNSRSGENTGVCFCFWTPGAKAGGSLLLRRLKSAAR